MLVFRHSQLVFPMLCFLRAWCETKEKSDSTTLLLQKLLQTYLVPENGVILEEWEPSKYLLSVVKLYVLYQEQHTCAVYVSECCWSKQCGLEYGNNWMFLGAWRNRGVSQRSSAHLWWGNYLCIKIVSFISPSSLQNSFLPVSIYFFLYCRLIVHRVELILFSWNYLSLCTYQIAWHQCMTFRVKSTWKQVAKYFSVLPPACQKRTIQHNDKGIMWNLWYSQVL